MAIEFRCAGCHYVLRAPDAMGGRHARCPRCQTVQEIPPVAGGEECSSEPPADGFPMPAPPAPPTDADFPQRTIIESGPRPLAADGFGAIRYGTSDFAGLFKLFLSMVFLIVAMYVLIAFFGGFLFLNTRIGFVVFIVPALMASLVVGGFFLRFCLDVVVSSTENLPSIPDIPPFHVKTNFVVGLKGLAVSLLCIGPVVTLPLLPLVLLAMAYSDDLRCLDLRWALRAAAKKSRQLLVLLLILLMWFLAAVAIVVLLRLVLMVMSEMAGSQDGVTRFLGVFGYLLCHAGTLAVGILFPVVAFRCIGMLGYRNPDLTEMLPEQLSSTAVFGYVMAGAVATVVLWGFAIPAVLR